MRRTAFVTLLFIAVASANAQGTIDPGMSKAQVIAKLGRPTSEHSTGATTYLYYKNGQEKKVGMSDMVALDNDKVVDAVFRGADRKYSGRSSSPAPVSAEAAIAKGGGTPRKAAPMKMPTKAPAKATTSPQKTQTTQAKAPEKAPAKAAAKVPEKAPVKAVPAPMKKTADTTKKAPTPAPTKKP